MAVLLAEKKYFDDKPEEEVVIVDGMNMTAVKRKRGATTAEEPPGKRRAKRGRGRADSQPGTLTGPVAGSSKRKRGTVAAEIDGDTRTTSKRPRHTQISASNSSPLINPTSPSKNEIGTSSSACLGREGHNLDVEAQRKVYHEAESIGANKSKQAGKTKREVIVGSAIDDFINARTREGLTCRRDILDVYFDNDKSGECLSELRIEAHGILMDNSHAPHR